MKSNPKAPFIRRTNNVATSIVWASVSAARVPMRESTFTSAHTCGQAVDKRDLGQVLHHEQPGHDRLTEN